MSLSNLPLSYCTNVHPGRTLAEIEHGLDQYTAPMAAGYARRWPPDYGSLRPWSRSSSRPTRNVAVSPTACLDAD